MLRAVTTVAAYDRDITVAEAELIRTVCASLDVPLPPITHRKGCLIPRRENVSNGLNSRMISAWAFWAFSEPTGSTIWI